MEIKDKFLTGTTSGAVLFNDTLVHATVDTLPFGGIGRSGMGAYHGKYSFDTFTHKKSVLVKNFNPIGEALASSRYPPYSDKKLNFLSKLMKKRRGLNFAYLPQIVMFVLGILAAYAFSSLSKSYGWFNGST